MFCIHIYSLEIVSFNIQCEKKGWKHSKKIKNTAKYFILPISIPPVSTGRWKQPPEADRQSLK
jgi:hypothetical protein